MKVTNTIVCDQMLHEQMAAIILLLLFVLDPYT